MRPRWHAMTLFVVLGAAGLRLDAARLEPTSQPDEDAPWWKSVEHFEKSMANDPQVIHRRYRGGTRILHVAAGRGDVAIVERLFELGADVNALSDGGSSALH